MVRDKEGIEIDPNYEVHFIPEHMIDCKRWPVGRKKELPTGNTGKSTSNMKKCVVSFKDTIYFYPSITEAIENYPWVRELASGATKQSEEKWFLMEEDYVPGQLILKTYNKKMGAWNNI